MKALLDANVLIAVAVVDHVHHSDAEAWFAALDGPFATCPITQGALLRLLIGHGATSEEAMRVLAGITRRDAHEFWPDDLDYGNVAMVGVIGHRQVTDAYLAGLARHRAAQLATFDNGLAALHPDVALLLPVEGAPAEPR